MGGSLALFLAAGIPLDAGCGKDHGSIKEQDHQHQSMTPAKSMEGSPYASGKDHGQPMKESMRSAASGKQDAIDSFNAAEASTLVGRKVMDKNGQDVGRITDFVVTFGEMGRVSHAVVGTGLFPGLAGTERVVPADALTRSNGSYHLTVTRKQFRKTEPVENSPEDWISSEENLKKLDQHYGVAANDNGRNHFLYSGLEGHSLVDKDGREIGEVTDLVVSMKQDLSPYFLVRPTGVFLPVKQGIRYGIPTTRIHSPDSDGYMEIATSLDSQTVRDAQRVDSMEDLSTDNTGRGLIFVYEG